MKQTEKRNVIKAWRLPDFDQLEYRQGWGVARPVPRHWHEEYQLCLIQAGSGNLIYRGDSFVTPPASLFLVHPGEVHSNHSLGRDGVSYRMLVIGSDMMRKAAADLTRKATDPPFFPTPVIFDREAITRYLNLHHALEQPSSRIERESLLLEFLTVLIERFAENRNSPQPWRSARKAAKLARDYLADHFNENVPLDTLASVANLSPFHLSRIFSEEFGMPPHAFQTQLRVLNARSLILHGWTVSQAAVEMGFADQSHLTRHFKRLVGVTPGQYLQNSKIVQDKL